MTVLVLDGATGAGKSHLLSHLRRRWADQIVVGAKFTTRPKRASDNEWEFCFVDAIPPQASEFSYGSVGHRYAIDLDQLEATVRSNRIYCVTCVDNQVIRLLRQHYKTIVLYIYRPLSAKEIERLFDERKTIVTSDIAARKSELSRIDEDYVEKLFLIDHVILNISRIANVEAQLDAIAESLVEPGDGSDEHEP